MRVRSAFCFIEQLKDNYFIVSGDEKVFDIYEKGTIYTLGIKFPRKQNRSLYFNKENIYVVGGNCQQVEVFNSVKRTWKYDIQQLPLNVKTFGISKVNSKFYIFGGFELGKNTASDKILSYDTKLDHFQISNININKKSSASSSFSRQFKVVIIWDSGNGGWTNTLAFDLNKVYAHGESLNHPSHSHVAPIIKNDVEIYFYSFNNKLCCYDVRLAVWNKLER